MPSVSVVLPYCHDLTSNHAYMNIGRGRRKLKPHVENWRVYCRMQIQQALWGYQPVPPLAIRIDWQGWNRPDEDGKCKVIWDAIQMATGIDDKHFVAEPGSWQRVKADKAVITVTISWEGNKE